MSKISQKDQHQRPRHKGVKSRFITVISFIVIQLLTPASVLSQERIIILERRPVEPKSQSFVATTPLSLGTFTSSLWSENGESVSTANGLLLQYNYNQWQSYSLHFSYRYQAFTGPSGDEVIVTRTLYELHLLGYYIDFSGSNSNGLRIGIEWGGGQSDTRDTILRGQLYFGYRFVLTPAIPIIPSFIINFGDQPIYALNLDLTFLI